MIVRWNDLDLETVKRFSFVPCWKEENGETSDFHIFIEIEAIGETLDTVGEINIACFESLESAKRYAVRLTEQAMKDGYIDLYNNELIEIY